MGGGRKSSFWYTDCTEKTERAEKNMDMVYGLLSIVHNPFTGKIDVTYTVTPYRRETYDEIFKAEKEAGSQCKR